MGTFQRTQEPPVVFAWYRGEHVAQNDRLRLADFGQSNVWYPFRECYFANGGDWAGEGERSLYLRFAGLTRIDTRTQRTREATQRELLVFARRYGLPAYCSPDGDRVAPWKGSYPCQWIAEDIRRMNAWLLVWESVCSSDARSARRALVKLREAQMQRLSRPTTRVLMPLAWGLAGRQSKDPSQPHAVAGFFRPPAITPQVLESLKNAPPLTFSRMVVWAMHGAGAQPNENLGGYSLLDVERAFGALVSPDPKKRARSFDHFAKAFQRGTGLCDPSDKGVLWFTGELLRFFVKTAVEEFSVATTEISFPGHAPGDLEEAMYLMFAYDVLAGLIVRRCANPRCRHDPFFTPDDPRQRFCCEACATANRQSRYRQKRKKAKSQGR